MEQKAYLKEGSLMTVEVHTQGERHIHGVVFPTNSTARDLLDL